MNIPNLTALSADLRTKCLSQFNMSIWAVGALTDEPLPASCFTCGCIAGDAVTLLAPNEPMTMDQIATRAAELLGLDKDTAYELFQPKQYSLIDTEDEETLYETTPRLFLPDNLLYGDVTPQDAAKVIDHLIATGEVDWRVIQ